MPGRAFFLIGIIACAGCDALNTKVENPVFGPPPPRTAHVNRDSDPDRSAWKDDTTVNAKTASTDAPLSQTSLVGDGKSAPVRFTGNEVIAKVNGQPIFASEILERAAVERLNAEGMTLLGARKAVDAGFMSETEFRDLQIAAFHRYLKEYVKTRLLSHALMTTLEKEQRDKINTALAKMFEDHIDGEKGLKKQLKVNTQNEVDAKMQEQGTSLASLKEEFTNQVMAAEYLHSKSKKVHVIGRHEMLSYYQEHLADYDVPEKVRWQILQISFDKHKGRKQALNVLEKAVDELKSGADFGEVVKKYSDGPKAEQGGNYGWTKPDSLADEKIAQCLASVEEGKTGDVIDAHESFKMIHVAERKPAGRKPFEEVQDSIRQTIEERNHKQDTADLLNELYRHAVIESPYITAEQAGAPAKDADLPATDQTPHDSKKKRRERS